MTDVKAIATIAFKSAADFSASWVGRGVRPFIEDIVRQSGKKLTDGVLTVDTFKEALNTIAGDPVKKAWLAKGIRGLVGVVHFKLPKSMFGGNTQQTDEASAALNDLLDELGKGVGDSVAGGGGDKLENITVNNVGEPMVAQVTGYSRRLIEEAHFIIIDPESKTAHLACPYCLDEKTENARRAGDEKSRAGKSLTAEQSAAIDQKYTTGFVPVPLSRAEDMGLERCKCLGEAPAAYQPTTDEKASLEVQIRDQIAAWQAVQAHLSNRGREVEDEIVREARDTVANDEGFMLRLKEALKGVNLEIEDFVKDGRRHVFTGVTDADPNDPNAIAPSVMAVVDVFKDAGGTASTKSWVRQVIDELFNIDQAKMKQSAKDFARRWGKWILGAGAVLALVLLIVFGSAILGILKVAYSGVFDFGTAWQAHDWPAVARSWFAITVSIFALYLVFDITLMILHAMKRGVLWVPTFIADVLPEKLFDLPVEGVSKHHSPVVMKITGAILAPFAMLTFLLCGPFILNTFFRVHEGWIGVAFLVIFGGFIGAVFYTMQNWELFGSRDDEEPALWARDKVKRRNRDSVHRIAGLAMLFGSLLLIPAVGIVRNVRMGFNHSVTVSEQNDTLMVEFEDGHVMDIRDSAFAQLYTSGKIQIRDIELPAKNWEDYFDGDFTAIKVLRIQTGAEIPDILDGHDIKLRANCYPKSLTDPDEKVLLANVRIKELRSSIEQSWRTQYTAQGLPSALIDSAIRGANQRKLNDDALALLEPHLATFVTNEKGLSGYIKPVPKKSAFELTYGVSGQVIWWFFLLLLLMLPVGGVMWIGPWKDIHRSGGIVVTSASVLLLVGVVLFALNWGATQYHDVIAGEGIYQSATLDWAYKSTKQDRRERRAQEEALAKGGHAAELVLGSSSESTPSGGLSNETRAKLEAMANRK